MLFSKNNVFKTDRRILDVMRYEIQELLRIKNVDIDFLNAFNYFCEHPLDFDGATIVKDLVDTPKLSISAMIHDYEYLINLPKYKGLKWLRYKILIDWEYGQNLELLGKGYFIPYLRAITLILTTPIYLIIKWIF